MAMRWCPVHPIHRHRLTFAKAIPALSFCRPRRRLCSKMAGEEADIGEFTEYMERLRNYEKLGVPAGSGTDSDDGFDLGRMRRLLRRLGDPHTDFKAVHIAGTKGKGSTAAFISSILRTEGYSVGCYTSPHLLSIRERITLGQDEPVAAMTLNNLFFRIKGILNKAIRQERGTLTHFEVFTALAFSLFSQEKVDVAVVEAGLGGARDATNILTSMGLSAAVITTIGEEHLAALGGSLESIAVAKAGIIKQGRPVVMGGPFEPHIDYILRQKASLMGSPVVSTCGPGIQSFIKSYGRQDDRPYQYCDISVEATEDFPLCIKLLNIKLFMLGEHQLQNAVTAACTSLCLRNEGWRISDESIRGGLEATSIAGRGQFLTCHEVEALELSGVSVLIDGAHTEDSAKSVVDIVKRTCRPNSLALVVAMASDKNHVAFCQQLLSGLQPDIFLLTEVSIARSRSRMTSASSLKSSCLHAASNLGISTCDLGMVGDDLPVQLPENISTLVGCSTESILGSLKTANRLLKLRSESNDRLIVVTGSLHIVSSVLAVIHQ